MVRINLSIMKGNPHAADAQNQYSFAHSLERLEISRSWADSFLFPIGNGPFLSHTLQGLFPGRILPCPCMSPSRSNQANQIPILLGEYVTLKFKAASGAPRDPEMGAFWTGEPQNAMVRIGARNPS